MSLLITVATGRRPLTAEVALKAMWLHVKDRVAEGDIAVHVVRWAPDAPELPGFRNLWLENATKPQCLNESLHMYKYEHDGELPRTWITQDDDAVWGLGLTSRLEAILAADPTIGLLGVWNEGQEQDRGDIRRLGTGLEEWPTEDVQYGTDFCVGGAVHAIPRHSLERHGGYDARWPRREDELLTAEVRAAGFEAAIAKSVYCAMLPDDQVEPWYRAWIRVRHFRDSEG